MATFADMMFLLLSFSTMDAIRFKKIAESVKDAFSVQKDVPVFDTPLGTSIIGQHFSPARTEPTPLEEVKQSVEQRLPTLATPEQRAAQLEALQLQAKELRALMVQAKQQDIEQSANQLRAAPFVSSRSVTNRMPRSRPTSTAD